MGDGEYDVPSSMAGRMVLKLSSTRMTSALSFATSVPLLPIDTPISAIFSAGASLTAHHARHNHKSNKKKVGTDLRRLSWPRQHRAPGTPPRSPSCALGSYAQ